MSAILGFLLPVLVGVLAAQQPKAQAKPGATSSGVFEGRAGKPMAKARLTLGEVVGDQETIHAKVKLVSNLPTVTTDAAGRFQISGFRPGSYTIVYQPAGVNALLPNEINVTAFSAVTRSTMPLLRDMEVGKSDPYPDRVWGRLFTLLKGHTFYLQGANMKVWNATARLGQQGPYLEIRRGTIWQEEFSDKGQIRLEAWSF